jgi:hypothetical protein
MYHLSLLIVCWWWLWNGVAVQAASKPDNTTTCASDIVFIIDVSTTITTAQFDSFKAMLRAVSDNIIIAPDRHRVALVRFWSYNARDRWTIKGLDEYQVNTRRDHDATVL